MMNQTALLILSFSLSAGAAQLSEDFSSRANFTSGTAIWNQALGKVHPTLQVMNYKAGFTPIPVDVGDGSDGVFDVSTYAKFSIGGDLSGNKIRFDTSAFPILKVTSFHLANGWILEPVGNNPLIIYSLSDIRIEGEIWCHGEDGGVPLGTIPGAGGKGRCGGGRGGDGGNGGGTPADGEDGTSPDASIGAGQHGSATVPGMSGGGGGSWNSDPSNAARASHDSNASGGNFGVSSGDAEFTNYLGGAGGGGGAGTTTGGGAGGGGAGGTVVLHAVGDINIGEVSSTTTGFIRANGGNGGITSGTGGTGGGGAGGGVVAFSGATINIYNSNGGDPAIDAGRGAGGNPTFPSTGLGAAGRNWFLSVTYNGVGFYSPSESTPLTPGVGNVEYDSATQYVITRSFDVRSSFPEYIAAAAVPVSADFVIEAAGSNDNFASDDTGFTTDFTQLKNKRFVRLRAKITTSDVNTPTMLDAITIDYTPSNRDEFNLKAAGCGRIDSGTGRPITLLPLLLVFGLLILLRRQKSSLT